MSELMIPQEEACRELDCSDVKLRQLIACGDIPAIQPGKAYVIPRLAFYDAVNALAVAEAAKRKGAAAPVPQPLPREKARRGPRQSAAGWAFMQSSPPPAGR